jgi:hypothetical protein
MGLRRTHFAALMRFDSTAQVICRPDMDVVVAQVEKVNIAHRMLNRLRVSVRFVACHPKPKA